MIVVSIPQKQEYKIENLILDFNGTVATDGFISEAVKEKLRQLSENLNIYIATADTYGTAKEQCKDIPVKLYTFTGAAAPAKAKLAFDLGKEKCACIGNGYNDIEMMQLCALSIAVIGDEGLCRGTLSVSDILVKNIMDGLSLLEKPSRLIADLRL